MRKEILDRSKGDKDMFKKPFCNGRYFLCLLLSCCFFIGSIYPQTVKIEPQNPQVAPQVSEESVGIQGNLQDMGMEANGSYDFETCVCDINDCNPAPLACTQNTNVPVTNGNYNYKVNFGNSIWDGNPRWFRIGVRRLPTDSYTILSPTQMISASPYAIYTFKAFMVVDNAITSASIMDNAITSADIADLSILRRHIGFALDGNDIADDSITSADIAENAITSSEIAANAVITNKIADNAVNSSKITDNSVTSADIQDGTITSLDIDSNIVFPPDSVNTSQIVDNAVTSNKLANNSVGTFTVIDGSLTLPDFALGSVDSSTIADNAVTSADIGPNAITTSKITDNAVTTTKLADQSVTISKLAPEVLTDPSFNVAGFTAVISDLGPFAGTDVFGSVTGITSATITESDVQTGMPNRNCNAGNLFVTQTVAPVSGTRTYILRVNGTDTSLACIIFGTNLTCNSTPGFTVPVLAGSIVSYKVVTTGSPATTRAMMGFECG